MARPISHKERGKWSVNTYVCKRIRLCKFLVERGFKPFKIVPDRKNDKYNVFLFEATPKLNDAVIEYFNQISRVKK